MIVNKPRRGLRSKLVPVSKHKPTKSIARKNKTGLYKYALNPPKEVWWYDVNAKANANQ